MSYAVSLRSSSHIEHEINSVKENVRDGQGGLGGGGVLVLQRRIVSPERFLSERPSDGPQRHIEHPSLGSFKHQ